MPAIWRMRRWLRTGVASVLLTLVIITGVFAGAGKAVAAGPGPGYVKYYVVAAAYKGQPENLSEIAGRFLGSTVRSGEIFNLNADMVQSGGGKLTDPASLRVGWALVLPWDAVGSGVQYGLLPRVAPAKLPSKPATPSKPAPPSKPEAPKPAAGAETAKCAGTPKNAVGNSQADWATLRLAPQNAWAHSRGSGVMVAIVDSGVDASLTELAGRVTVGADIITGTGRGNTDCVGSGTAMAGIVAARSDATGGGIGMAPEATVMPVRVAPTDAAVSEADQASAISVAVAAGATVIALGRYIDPTLAAVASAIEQATANNVVVVTGAPTRSSEDGGTAPGAPASMPGVIRAGAINIDGAAGATYQPGAVDVVAPGVGVTSLGISGTGQVEGSGTEYAVAFVAGEVALVRAMYPNLTAAEVVRRIEATADRMGSTAPDATFGWGLINPAVALTRVIADEGRNPEPSTETVASEGWSSGRTKALVIVVLLAVVLVLLLVLRIRRMVRPAALGGAADAELALGLPVGGLPAANAVPTVVGATVPGDPRSVGAGAVSVGTGSVASGAIGSGSADGRPAWAAGTWGTGQEAGGQSRGTAAQSPTAGSPTEPGPDNLSGSGTEWRHSRSSTRA